MKRFFSLVVLGMFSVTLMAGCGISKPIKHEVKADFNKDGYNDILTIETRLKSGYHLVTIAFGTGKENSFKKPVKVLKISKNVFKGKNITAVKCGDYNSDGNIDLMLESTEYLDARKLVGVSIYLEIYGNGDGTFQGDKGITTIPLKKK